MKARADMIGWLGLAGSITSELFLFSSGMVWQVNAQTEGQPELRQSLAGEQGILELKQAMTNEVYHLHYGHVGIQTEATMGAAFTDNVFLSAVNKQSDFILNPQAN